MIRAVFAERPEQLLFTCDGHAGGDKGSDIVCAAVSTAVELMKRMLTAKCEEKDGSVRLELRGLTLGELTEFIVFRQWFEDMARQYPDRVSVDAF